MAFFTGAIREGAAGHSSASARLAIVASRRTQTLNPASVPRPGQAEASHSRLSWAGGIMVATQPETKVHIGRPRIEPELQLDCC